MTSTMTAELAINTTWECAELGGNKASTITACDSVGLVPRDIIDTIKNQSWDTLRRRKRC